MKRFLIILVALFWCSVGVAKNLPTLECEYNDTKRTKVIYNLNNYTDDDWSMTDEEYGWTITEIKNDMKTLTITAINRKTGVVELTVSKPFPVVSDIGVVMNAIMNGEVVHGICKKIEDKNL